MTAFHRQRIDHTHGTVTVLRTGETRGVGCGNQRGSFVWTEVDRDAAAVRCDDGYIYACNTGVLTRNGDIQWSDDVRRH